MAHLIHTYKVSYVNDLNGWDGENMLFGITVKYKMLCLSSGLEQKFRDVVALKYNMEMLLKMPIVTNSGYKYVVRLGAHATYYRINNGCWGTDGN